VRSRAPHVAFLAEKPAWPYADHALH